MTDCKLIFARGSIFLVGNQINFIALKWKSLLSDSIPKAFFDNREKRDGEEFHLTVLGKRQLVDLASEIGRTKENLIEEIFTAARGINLASFVDVGLGKATDEEGNCSWFVVVSFENLRNVLKPFFDCKPVNFHITLAFNPLDPHSVSKDLSSLMVGPINQGYLFPGKDLIDEIKALTRNSYHWEALKIVNCAKVTAELLEIKALLLFKLENYEECLNTTEEIIEKFPEMLPKFKVLTMIRQADALIAMKRFRRALFPIWSAFYLIIKEQDLAAELKLNAKSHLINLLKKCAINGYLRIDALPVSRKKFQELSGADAGVIIQDEFASKCFQLYGKFVAK
jgi:hypothetical protein